MKKGLYLLFIIFTAALAVYVASADISILSKFFYPLIYCVLLCVVRLVMDATTPERTVSIDILGIVVLGICAVLALFTGKSFYMDIALAWALQSFIGMLALAKYLEGRKLDE